MLKRVKKKSNLWIIFAMTIAYTVLALWHCRSMFAHFSEGIPFRYAAGTSTFGGIYPTDSSQLLYYFWNFTENLKNFELPLMNYHEFAELNPSHIHRLGLWGFPVQFPFAFFSLFMSLAAAYNLTLILSFSLTGVLQAILCRILGFSWWPSFIAGIIYAFAFSRRTQMFAGHTNALLYFHLTLVFLCLYKMMQSISFDSKSATKWALGTGLSLLMISFGEWHMFYYTSLFCAPLFIFFFFYFGTRKQLRKKQLWVSVALLFTLSTASVGYSIWLKNQVIKGSVAESNRGKKQVRGVSPPIKRFTQRKTFGKQKIYQVESSIDFGKDNLYALLILFILSVITYFLRRKKTKTTKQLEDNVDNKDNAPPLLSLEDDQKTEEYSRLKIQSAPKHINRYANNTQIPRFSFFFFLTLTALLSGLLALGIHKDGPQLYTFLYQYLPFWKLSRVPTRLIYFTHFSFSIMVAFLLHYLMQNIKNIRLFQNSKPEITRHIKKITALLLFMISFTFIYYLSIKSPNIWLSSTQIKSSKVYDYIDSLSSKESGPLLFLPIYGSDDWDNAGFELLATRLKKPFINGYAPTAPTKATTLLKDLGSMNKGMLTRQAHCGVWKAGAKFLIYDKNIQFLRRNKVKKGAVKKLLKAGVIKEKRSDHKVYLYEIAQPQNCE